MMICIEHFKDENVLAVCPVVLVIVDAFFEN